MAAETNSSPDESPSSYCRIQRAGSTSSQVQFSCVYFSRRTGLRLAFVVHQMQRVAARCTSRAGMSATQFSRVFKLLTPNCWRGVFYVLYASRRTACARAIYLILPAAGAAQQEQPDYSKLFDKIEVMISAGGQARGQPWQVAAPPVSKPWAAEPVPGRAPPRSQTSPKSRARQAPSGKRPFLFAH